MAVETVAKVAVATTAMAVLVGLIYWKFFMVPPQPHYGYGYPPPAPPPAPEGYDYEKELEGGLVQAQETFG